MANYSHSTAGFSGYEVYLGEATIHMGRHIQDFSLKRKKNLGLI